MIDLTKQESPFRVTRKGLYLKYDCWTYFMYFSDTTHIYKVFPSGRKVRINPSKYHCGREKYNALRDAIVSAKLLRTDKKILEDIDASKGQIVIVREARRKYKIHIFKFYGCGHVYYNQGVEGERGLLKNMQVFYRKFSQIYNSYGFGYQEYLDVARDLRDIYGTDETIVYDLGGAA